MKTRNEQRPRRRQKAIRPSTQTTATTATPRPQARQGLQPKLLSPPRRGPAWKPRQLHPKADLEAAPACTKALRLGLRQERHSRRTNGRNHVLCHYKASTEVVHKVLEGLREEAFELARDIGIEALTAPGGLRDFISRMRNVVFPRAAEEARELFKAGQRQGALARQSGESMLPPVLACLLRALWVRLRVSGHRGRH